MFCDLGAELPNTPISEHGWLVGLLCKNPFGLLGHQYQLAVTRVEPANDRSNMLLNIGEHIAHLAA